MLKINPQYLVDDKGEKTAALLTIKEFQLLMPRLEDLEDTLEMDTEVETETEFRDYQDIRAEIMRERTGEPMGDILWKRRIPWNLKTYLNSSTQPQSE